MKTMIFILICIFALLGGINVDAGIYSPSTLQVTSANTVALDQQIYVDNTVYSTYFTVLNNGNVGIGTYNPKQKLQVDGSIYIYGGAIAPHIKIAQTTKPTIGTPTSCGTSPSATVTDESTDIAGSFSVTAGSGLPTSCNTVFTFNNAFLSAPKSVIVSAAPTVSGTYPFGVRVVSATTFEVFYPASPGAGLTNKTFYWVIE